MHSLQNKFTSEFFPHPLHFNLWLFEQWATPSTEVDTMLPESVVEFQDFQAHQTQAEHFSYAVSI